MKTLTIFHDPRCGLCAAFKEWLNRQPKYLEARFIPYNAPAAAKLFPGLQEMGAGKDVVVLADDGSWWQGEAAWLTCLWITRDYRPWSYRFRSPLLQPLVRRAIHLLSENRLTISRLLHLRQDEELADAIHSLPETHCQTGTCNFESPFRFKTPPPLPK